MNNNRCSKAERNDFEFDLLLRVKYRKYIWWCESYNWWCYTDIGTDRNRKARLKSHLKETFFYLFPWSLRRCDTLKICESI